jgi:hypothetical protein
MSAPPIWHNVGDTSDFLYPTLTFATGITNHSGFSTLFGPLGIAKDGYVAYMRGAVTTSPTEGLPTHNQTLVTLPRPYWPHSPRPGVALGTPVMVGVNPDPSGVTGGQDISFGALGIFDTGVIIFWRTLQTATNTNYVELAHSWVTDVDGE